ncbi:MAG: putative oxidoreductase YvaA [Lentisphaerae bacterium ADurb.Bin242]|nr:MAG: putative oxidoreductase YvaA [Lentisphaerae bacterium ADurb.Bin242]
MKKIILAGFGFMGQTHAGNILSIPGLELAAVVDRVPKEQLRPAKGNINTRRIDWERIHDIPFYPALDKAMNSCEADAVVIAAPTGMHYPCILAALAHNKHVFVEKPLCFRREEAEEIRKNLAGTGLVFQVGHCVRFQREYRYLASLITERTCGRLLFLQLYRYSGTPAWGDWKNSGTAEESGGTLFDLNIHDIDYALSVLGEPHTFRVNPTVRNRFGNGVLDATWEYRDGLIVRIEGGFFPPSTLPFRAGYTAVFEKLSLEFRSLNGLVVARHGLENSDFLDFSDENDPYLEEIRAFADSLENGTKVRCGLDEASLAVEYCHRLSAAQ